MRGPIDLGGEAWDKAVQVADGFWIIAAQHHLLFNSRFPRINNRILVFRLIDRGKPVLVVVNGMTESAIPEVRRIATETGLEVAYDISPGGAHHVTLDAWHDAFPSARILILPARTPRTANGRKLLELPRVEIMDAADPLPQFRGQLDTVMFNLLGFRDLATSREGHKEVGMLRQSVRMLRQMPLSDPCDELWLHHVASGTVIGAENLGMMANAVQRQQLPLMMRMQFKPDSVWVMASGRRAGDKPRVAAAWREVLAWPMKALISYHDGPGTAFTGDCRATLEAAVRKVKQL